MEVRQDAFQLGVGGSERLCVWRAPAAGSLRARIVHVHAFAEEMNKCRSIVADAARRLAGQGFGVLEIDLRGCGDSAGDFGDATFEGWIDDVLAAMAWTGGVSDAPLWLWGLRGGALVAGAASRHGGAVSGLLLWQPVLSGRAQLTQFLRLKFAADVLAHGAAGRGTAELRATLQRGVALEVAGYRLSPALAGALDRAEFGCGDSVNTVVWLEAGSTAAPAIAPASQTTIAVLRARGVQVLARAIEGPMFWQTVEIEPAPALVATTVEAMVQETARALARDSILP